MWIYWDIHSTSDEHSVGLMLPGQRQRQRRSFGFNAVAIDLCTVHLSYSEGAGDLHSVLDETTQIICQRLSYCCFPLSGEFGLIPACSQMDVARQHGWGPSLPAVASVGKPTRSQKHTYGGTPASKLLRVSGELHHMYKAGTWVGRVGNKGKSFVWWGGIIVVIRLTLAFPKIQRDEVVQHSAWWNQQSSTAIRNMMNVRYVRI